MTTGRLGVKVSQQIFESEGVMAGPRGFIDIQINGIAGIDFTSEDLTLDAVRRAADELAARGTAAFCPTVLETTDDVMQRNLGLLARAAEEPGTKGRVLGMHLEGPFLSPNDGARGAHNADIVRNPSVDYFERLWEWANGKIAILTLAPELPGAEQVIRLAAERGVVVALGHTEADAAAVRMACGAGARLSTHLGNGIASSIDRHNNPIWPQLAADELFASFITDGHHIPPDFIKAAMRAKGIDRSIVVSDGTWISGLPTGDYTQRGRKLVLDASGRLSLAGTSYLAGSAATMLECMNYLASLNVLTEDDLWRTAWDNPLKLLGLSESDIAPCKACVKYENNRFKVEVQPDEQQD